MKYFFLTVLFSFQVHAVSYPFTNLNSIKQNLNFDSHYLKPHGAALKVAVLDKGFKGYEKEIGQTLPANTFYSSGPLSSPESAGVDHGLKMAQILVGLMTDQQKHTELNPQLYLYNVAGFTNFKAAIDDLIQNQVDVVLYSEVWDFGDNFDGKGFLNAEVNRATKSGVIWVNAAGNFAGYTYNAPIVTAAEDWVVLPDNNQALQLNCVPANGLAQCPARIVLSWTGYHDDVNLGTNKDLDLALMDDLLNVVQSSSLKQSDDTSESRPGYSKYSREIVEANLNTGTYFIKVKNRSHNFSDKDSLRISVSGEGLNLKSGHSEESLNNPADNASVITVGASDSDRSSSSIKLGKPDLYTPSSILLSNGEEFRGSSNSAAIVAAGVCLLKSENLSLTRKQVLSRIVQVNEADPGSGLSLSELQFNFTGDNCFQAASLPSTPVYIQQILNRGGTLVQTTEGARILVPFDPLTLDSTLERQNYDDMIVATPHGLKVLARNSAAPFPNGWVEVFERPQEAGVCGAASSGAKNFRLPEY